MNTADHANSCTGADTGQLHLHALADDAGGKHRRGGEEDGRTLFHGDGAAAAALAVSPET
jgi:hypothetical protein